MTLIVFIIQSQGHTISIDIGKYVESALIKSALIPERTIIQSGLKVDVTRLR